MSAFLLIASVEPYSNDREQNERDHKRAAEMAAIPGQKVAREKCIKRCEPMFRPDRQAVDQCINRCVNGETSRSGTASSDSLIQSAPSKMPNGTATVGESADPKEKSKKPGGESFKPNLMVTAQIH